LNVIPHRFGLSVILALSFSSCDHQSPPRYFRVCADRNNLPYSNQKLEGFENRLAELTAYGVPLLPLDR
jgi:mxaJ protein